VNIDPAGAVTESRTGTGMPYSVERSRGTRPALSIQTRNYSQVLLSELDGLAAPHTQGFLLSRPAEADVDEGFVREGIST
jgi:hypothetical protein